MLGGSGLFHASLFPRLSRPPLTFEEIPASASGISWVHVNGRSPMAHLPETVGAGCAFLDYDNDGWMDIYLVNSGRAISISRRSRCETRSTTTIATAHLPT